MTLDPVNLCAFEMESNIAEEENNVHIYIYMTVY